MKNSLTADLLVAEWGGFKAQIQNNFSISEVAADPSVPTIVDVNIVFGNTTSLSLISEHLKSILRYSGVDTSASALSANQPFALQIMETAFTISSNYYYLNLMELALFFREVKSGKRGQVVWGNKLNTQELMVRLAEFVADRACAIEKNEMEARKAEERKGFTTIKQAGAAITDGVNGWRRMLEEAKTNYDRFLQMFPKFPDILSPTGWYNAWLGEQESLVKIFGETYPENYEDAIIKHLCDYNVSKK